MKVTGFTFIRNAIQNDYPIVEAIQSILPLCDEFVVAVGQGSDETLQLIQNINSPKIKIIETIWDESIREGGRTFALETDKAYAAISADTDWAFYIQGDECVHEKYLPVIKKAMEDNLNKEQVEGLLFKYLHFYGSYDYTASSRRWYRNEIRVLKFKPGVKSYRDAQGFRKDDKKIKVKPIDAYIYHYGWVKPPKGLGNKVRNFNQFYHDDSWLEENTPANLKFDYGNADRLLKFAETHPLVMQKRIKAVNWKFDFDPLLIKNKMNLRRKLLQKLEDFTGWRLGEYKNYRKI
ncbi:MAG TPA: glycosyltransferase family 2 protein [Daejeonella sp.]|nr:glycosyltransferase family 2 protein [Daejeonella sp.]